MTQNPAIQEAYDTGFADGRVEAITDIITKLTVAMDVPEQGNDFDTGARAAVAAIRARLTLMLMGEVIW